MFHQLFPQPSNILPLAYSQKTERYTVSSNLNPKKDLNMFAKIIGLFAITRMALGEDCNGLSFGPFSLPPDQCFGCLVVYMKQFDDII